jgi:MtN3 and saliva related transmembrane protein
VVASIFGIAAAIVGVSAFLPQAWRVIKTRDTKDLATHMWILNVAAFALWVVYGLELGKLAIVVPNIINLLLSAFILVMKLVSGDAKQKIANKVDPT